MFPTEFNTETKRGKHTIVASTTENTLISTKESAHIKPAQAKELTEDKTDGTGNKMTKSVMKSTLRPRKVTVKSDAVRAAKGDKSTKTASITENLWIANNQTVNTESTQAGDLAEEEDNLTNEEDTTIFISRDADGFNITERPVVNGSDASGRLENTSDFTYLVVEEGGSMTNESNGPTMRSLSLSSKKTPGIYIA